MTTIEQQLVDLGEHLDVPDAPDLAAVVVARVQEARPPLVRRQRRRRVAIGAAIAALVASVPLAPAVGDWLGVRGARVRREAGPPSAIGAPLALGRPTTLAAGAREAGFRPFVPELLGPPDEVWIDALPAVPVLWLVYRDGPLIGQFRARLPEQVIFEKFAGPGTTVEELTVDGARGVWVAGVHEVAVRVDRAVHLDRLRISDSALLLERGDVTVRIETRAGRDEAVRIARNLRPARGVERS